MNDSQAIASTLLHSQGLHKNYRMGGQDLHVLRGVDFAARRGEWVSIVGASGSGKSTLLHLLGGLDRPDAGTVQFEGRDIFNAGNGSLDRYRRRSIGFVFQFYHLLPELTAFENVLIGAMIGRSLIAWPSDKQKFRLRAKDLLTRLGLAGRLTHKPSKLSGGERQRVAIARALINQPPVLLADEPTGNLDAETGRQLLDVFEQFHRNGQTIIMVTHNSNVADLAQRRLTLKHGRLRA